MSPPRPIRSSHVVTGMCVAVGGDGADRHAVLGEAEAEALLAEWLAGLRITQAASGPHPDASPGLRIEQLHIAADAWELASQRESTLYGLLARRLRERVSRLASDTECTGAGTRLLAAEARLALWVRLADARGTLAEELRGLRHVP